MALLLSLGVLAGAFILHTLILRSLDRFASAKEVPLKRAFYIKRFFTIVIVFTAAVTVALIYSVDFKGLLLFTSSVFAVVGVALFAQWSILSNVTASILIFFNFPARIGDRIKIVDGDNSVEGPIIEITLFNVILENGTDRVIYPNSLLLQKPVVKTQKAEDAP